MIAETSASSAGDIWVCSHWNMPNNTVCHLCKSPAHWSCPV